MQSIASNLANELTGRSYKVNPIAIAHHLALAADPDDTFDLTFSNNIFKFEFNDSSSCYVILCGRTWIAEHIGPPAR